MYIFHVYMHIHTQTQTQLLESLTGTHILIFTFALNFSVCRYTGLFRENTGLFNGCAVLFCGCIRTQT